MNQRLGNQHNLDLTQEEDNIKLILNRRGKSSLSEVNSLNQRIYGFKNKYTSIKTQSYGMQSYNARYNSCSICLENTKTEFIYINTCNHCFCTECLSIYIQIRIEERQVSIIPCPNHQCHSKILDSEIVHMVDSRLYQNYLKFKKVEELNKNSFLKWCPKPDCEGYDIGSLRNSKLKCNVCKHRYCFYCRESWHYWKRCKLSQDKQIDEWAKENGIKYCPKCKIKIEKLEGCDYMTCPICQYNWCWKCGDNHPEHYCIVKAEAIVEIREVKNYVIIFLIFGHFFFIIAGLNLGIIIIYSLKSRKLAINEKIVDLITAHKKLSYFSAIILGILLNPLLILISFYLFSYLSLGYLFESFENKKKLRLLLSALTYPIVCILIGFFIVISPLIGILLLVMKIFIAIRDPKVEETIEKKKQYGIN